MQIEPGDPTVGTRMKISLPRPKDFINFNRRLQRAVKGREMRERKEKEMSKLWENRGVAAALEVIEAFARFSCEIRRKWIWNLNAICEFFHCWILGRFKIRRKWKTMQTCRRCQLESQCEGELGWSIAMITRRKCCDKQRNTKNRHVFLGWCSYTTSIPFENMQQFFSATKSQSSWLNNFINGEWKSPAAIEVNFEVEKVCGRKISLLLKPTKCENEVAIEWTHKSSRSRFSRRLLELRRVTATKEKWTSTKSLLNLIYRSYFENDWIAADERTEEEKRNCCRCRCWHTRHIKLLRVRC